MTRDEEAVNRYYEKVCGWPFTSVPVGPGSPDYVLGMKDDRPIVSVMSSKDSSGDETTEPFWMTYFAVDDVDAAAEETIAMAGTLTREPFEVPDTGRIAIVTDPTGALL
jgi:uncharacterized protein